MLRADETICAPSTGTGGAISVIRVSGPECLDICSHIFFPSDKSVFLSDQQGYNLIYGQIRSGDETIDDVLVSVFRSPRSYTGQDSVEISCHASSYIQRRILE